MSIGYSSSVIWIPPKNFICPSGKWRIEITSPGLSDATFFAPCPYHHRRYILSHGNYYFVSFLWNKYNRKNLQILETPCHGTYFTARICKSLAFNNNYVRSDLFNVQPNTSCCSSRRSCCGSNISIVYTMGCKFCDSRWHFSTEHRSCEGQRSCFGWQFVHLLWPVAEPPVKRPTASPHNTRWRAGHSCCCLLLGSTCTCRPRASLFWLAASVWWHIPRYQGAASQFVFNGTLWSTK